MTAKRFCFLQMTLNDKSNTDLGWNEFGANVFFFLKYLVYFFNL